MFRGFRPWSKLAGFALLGGFFGGASYVAYISNAASYLSDDPKACINCHIMTPMYASWQHSSHARVATCNDCHVPQDSLLRKYAFKANDGLRHSYLFTTRQERQVIEAIPASKAVIQQNCIRCHEPTLQRASTSVAHFEKRPCIECHREVPHGREHSLSSTPNAAVPPLEPVTPEWMRKRP
jgi:cytochrome c nitrite reductase small subunit